MSNRKNVFGIIRDIILSYRKELQEFEKIYIHPNIPEKLLSNALSKQKDAKGNKIEYEILVLVDTTIIESATDSWLIYEYGISCSSGGMFKRYQSNFNWFDLSVNEVEDAGVFANYDWDEWENIKEDVASTRYSGSSWCIGKEDFFTNVPTDKKISPILLQMFREIIRYLIKKPKDVYEAVFFDNKEAVEKRLTENYCNIEGDYSKGKNFNGYTLLMRACGWGRIDMVEYLLSKGASVNFYNSEYQAAILRSYDNVHILKKLLKYGANINLANSYGTTVLLFAAGYGYFESVKFLVENHADIHHKDKDGDTSLILSVLREDRGYYKIAKLLIEHGADIYTKNNDGDSFVSLVEEHGFTKLQALAHSKTTELAVIQGDNYEAFWAYYQMLQKDKSITDYQPFYEHYQNLLLNFDKIHRKRRKILYIDNQLPEKRPDSFLPMLDTEKIEIEDYLKFPVGHPVKGELYVGHPHNPNTYFCLKDYEQALFMDKVMEINYIFQCLGATQITIDYAKGSNMELRRSFETQQGLEANMGRSIGKTKIKIVGGGSEFGTEKSNNKKSSSSQSLRTIQTFEPSKSPYIPENVIWYHHDIHLQSVSKQRMEGNILDYTITISSKDVKIVSETEIHNISLEVNTIFYNVSGSLKKTLENQQSNQETTEWIISVQFAPKNQLLETNDQSNQNMIALQSNNELTEIEQKYLEEVKDMLEDDGEIDNAERKILERKREKFGISLERAKEIENMTNPLSEDEQDYLEDVEGFLQDEGEITATARKALNRRADKLGISPERIVEIEAMVINKK